MPVINSFHTHNFTYCTVSPRHTQYGSVASKTSKHVILWRAKPHHSLLYHCDFYTASSTTLNVITPNTNRTFRLSASLLTANFQNTFIYIYFFALFSLFFLSLFYSSTFTLHVKDSLQKLHMSTSHACTKITPTSVSSRIFLAGWM